LDCTYVLPADGFFDYYLWNCLDHAYSILLMRTNFVSALLMAWHRLSNIILLRTNLPFWLFLLYYQCHSPIAMRTSAVFSNCLRLARCAPVVARSFLLASSLSNNCNYQINCD
jgi:hypothetical protein